MDSPCTLLQNFPGLSSSIHALLHDLSHVVCPLLGAVLAAPASSSLAFPMGP